MSLDITPDEILEPVTIYDQSGQAEAECGIWLPESGHIITVEVADVEHLLSFELLKAHYELQKLAVLAGCRRDGQ